LRLFSCSFWIVTNKFTRPEPTFGAVHMSANGIVSRVTPVHTAVRNCTRDEGRPFQVGNQVLIASHRKLLLSKAMWQSVASGTLLSLTGLDAQHVILSGENGSKFQ
jgi:hypothetical protein